MTRSILKIRSLVFRYLPVPTRHRFWFYLARIGFQRWGRHETPQRIPFGATMIKAGPYVRPQEAAATQFVYQHTTIPVPYVVDCYVYNGETYIIQEYLEGHVLSRHFRTMDESSCAALARNLSALLSQLRALRPPRNAKTVVCGFGGHPLFDLRISFNLDPFGPFSSVADFHCAFMTKSYLVIPEEDRSSVLDCITTAHSRHQRVVLTYNDLHPDNIMVDRHDPTKIVGIMDWEATAWLPEYWEYIKSLSVFRFRKGKWPEIMTAALPGYELEIEVDELFMQYQQDFD